jgi:predicted nicotinamide N-methyase
MLVDAEALLLEHTRVERPALVPEVQLYLAEKIVPLWQATEWRMAAPQPPPFWAFAWPGSQAIARFLLDAPELAEKKRVLDFGSGSGLAAIAAAVCGALEVVACDLDPLAAVAQRLNAALNRVSVRSLTCDGVDLHDDVDVVLAGDVCYEREPAEANLTWLRQVAAHAYVLLADPGRHYAPSEGIELLAQYDVPVLRDLESVDVKRTRLWRLLP